VKVAGAGISDAAFRTAARHQIVVVVVVRRIAARVAVHAARAAATADRAAVAATALFLLDGRHNSRRRFHRRHRLLVAVRVDRSETAAQAAATSLAIAPQIARRKLLQNFVATWSRIPFVIRVGPFQRWSTRSFAFWSFSLEGKKKKDRSN